MSFWQKATELGLPQQAAEKTHLPGGGRADSGPVHGVGSLVQQPIEEEQQQRAQGNEFVSGMHYNVVVCMYIYYVYIYCVWYTINLSLFLHEKVAN